MRKWQSAETADRMLTFSLGGISCMKHRIVALGGSALLCLCAAGTLLLGAGRPAQLQPSSVQQPVVDLDELESLDWQLPNDKWLRPFAERQPIYFVTRTSNIEEWLKLDQFWNETTESALDPYTGQEVKRQVVKIKVPLGLSQAPRPNPTNEMTVDRWILGKKLYFDPVLSSDNTVSCSSCHDPDRGWTDQSAVSIGIAGKKGGVSAPPVFNAAYNAFQFWDGRADSLEDQAQGPVGNPVEMFGGVGHAWRDAVRRVRKSPELVAAFKKAYGTEPTRDAAAKAIAVYERTVLRGNAIFDRADFAKAIRGAEEGKLDDQPQVEDYEKVLQEAFAQQDKNALQALQLNPAKDKGKIAQTAKSIFKGQKLYFGKARCNGCHVGDNFTDNQFHNLGVGVNSKGQLPAKGLGRFQALPTGAKDPDAVGAFKTPGLRGLLDTAPYMHDGSEKTLAEVIKFYNRGGNANRYLDLKMRDFDAEKAYIQARNSKKEYKGPKVYLFGPDATPIVPLELKLDDAEERDLEMFLRALHSDQADPLVADPDRMPPILSAERKK